MADVEITCIKMVPRQIPHEGITHVGNAAGIWTREQVVEWIRLGQQTFYTMLDGQRADIGVVDGPWGPPYTRQRLLE